MAKGGVLWTFAGERDRSRADTTEFDMMLLQSLDGGRVGLKCEIRMHEKAVPESVRGKAYSQIVVLDPVSAHRLGVALVKWSKPKTKPWWQGDDWVTFAKTVAAMVAMFLAVNVIMNMTGG